MLTHHAFGRIPARQREDHQLRGSSALRGFWELQSEGCPIARIVCEKACPKRSRMGGASRLEIFQRWVAPSFAFFAKGWNHDSRRNGSGKPPHPVLPSLPMSKLNKPKIRLTAALLCLALTASAADLPSKKYLNLAAIKTMVAAAEAEAQRQHVEVTLCIVDESGNLHFLEKADTAPLNTIQWAQKKARHAAFYKSPSKDASQTVKNG